MNVVKPKRLIYGVLYNSGGKYKSRNNNIVTRAYRTWNDMGRRCYSPKYHMLQPTYSDCSVDPRFHDFQDFAHWFYNHKYAYESYQLDKDILFDGNKVYSPATCCFVPQVLNSLLNDCEAIRGDLPQGVSLRKDTGKYRVIFSVKGELRRLGQFDCPIEASKVYKIAKEQYVKEMALEWQDRIAPDVFEALMNWRLKL